MQERYLVQVCRDKLTDYIMKAIIAPDSLMGEECHIDTQSKYKDVVLLSDSVIGNLDEYEEVLIELNLTADEIKNELIPTDVAGISYTQIPLPISRIKKIYVQSEKEKTHILKKIATNQKGFIPEFLLEVKQHLKTLKTPNIKPKKQDYKNKLIKYDKLLGMLCYMKSVEYHYADKNKRLKNYANDYFSIVDAYISNNYKNNKFLNSLKTTVLEKKFIEILTKEKRFSKDVLVDEFLIYVEDEKIKQLFQKLIDDPLQKLEVLKKLKKGSLYFYVCLLYMNSDKHSNKMTNFKTMLNKQVEYKYAQKALAYLGYYYGYEILDASEEITIKDRYFRSLLPNGVVNTKFGLDKKFDYITIESVYQHIFYDHVKGFEVVDVEFLATLKNTQQNDWYKKTVLDEKFGEESFSIKKLTKKEFILNKLSRYLKEISPNRYIAPFYQRHFAKDEFQNHIDRDIFIEKIESEKLSSSQQSELLKAMKMDEEYHV